MATPVVFEDGCGCWCTTTTKRATSSFDAAMNRNGPQKKHHKGVDPCVEVMAERLNELSVEEREAILEEIHGVSEMQDEDPTFIDRHLRLLDEELNSSRSTSVSNSITINNNSGSSCCYGDIRLAYDLAKSMDIKFVKRRKFLLSFLRADEFNIQDATKRIINHFHLKLELFGKEKLVKDITFDDLSPNDQEAAMAGSHQFLNVKDVRGRTVLFVFPQLITGASVENYLRAQWYHSMIASELESTQRHGVVVIMMGNFKGKYIHWAMKGQRTIVPTFPLRLVSMHICRLRQELPPFFRSMLDILGRNFQLRARFHMADSTISNLYALQSFGINPITVPLLHDGQPNRQAFLHVLEQRIQFEQQQEDESCGSSISNSSSTSSTQSTSSTSSSEIDTTEDMIPSIPKSITSNTSNNSNTTKEVLIPSITKSNIDKQQIPFEKQQQQKRRPSRAKSTKSSSSNIDSTSNRNTTSTTTTTTTKTKTKTNTNTNVTTNGGAGGIVPANRDVLLGRGFKHPGNFILDKLIDIELVAHQKAVTTFDKTCIVLATVRCIESSGGRFLKRDNKRNIWVIADNSAAHETVSNRFRKRSKQRGL